MASPPASDPSKLRTANHTVVVDATVVISRELRDSVRRVTDTMKRLMDTIEEFAERDDEPSQSMRADFVRDESGVEPLQARAQHIGEWLVDLGQMIQRMDQTGMIISPGFLDRAMQFHQRCSEKMIGWRSTPLGEQIEGRHCPLMRV